MNDSGGEVVDPGMARSARDQSADPTGRPDFDPSADPNNGRSVAESCDTTARRLVDLPTAKAAEQYHFDGHSRPRQSAAVVRDHETESSGER